jgi:hypothetical protein
VADAAQFADAVGPCPGPRDGAYRKDSPTPGYFSVNLLKKERRTFRSQGAVAISVISRCDETGCETLELTFCCNWEIKSRKSVYFILFNKFLFASQPAQVTPANA